MPRSTRPEEKFPGGRLNDGSQRWPNEGREPRGYRLGTVLGQTIGNDVPTSGKASLLSN